MANAEAQTFASLPTELLEEVFARLDVSSVHSVLLSCKRFHEVARSSPRIWRSLCRRLGRCVPPGSDLRLPVQAAAAAAAAAIPSVPEEEPYRTEKVFLAKLLRLKRSMRRGSCRKFRIGRNGRAAVPSTSEEVIARTKISSSPPSSLWYTACPPPSSHYFQRDKPFY